MSAPLAEVPAQQGRAAGWALAALVLSAFILGTGETMPVGTLTLIADSTHTSNSAAGALVSTYALSLALGGIFLSLATARLRRRPVMLGALAATVVANLVLSLSDHLPTLLGARIIGGSAHGLFIGAAISTAVTLVSPDRIGRAIGAILTGLAASTALGVPAGVIIASAFGWHTAFVVVTGISAALWVALQVLVPDRPAAAGLSIGAQARYALAGPVLVVLGLAFAIFAGEYAAFTYVSPFLQQVSGVSTTAVGVFVLIFGVAAAIGATLGGRLADWNAHATLALATAALPVVLGGVLTLGVSVPGAALSLTVWGLVVIAFVPSVQYLVAKNAGPGAELAAVFPAAGINFGIAAGSLVGGIATDAAGPRGPFVVGIVVCLAVAPLTALLWLRTRGRVADAQVDAGGEADEAPAAPVLPR